MEIPLQLTGHCVETEIKRKYNRLLSKYFTLSAPEDRLGAEAAIAMLKTALERLDFGWLRSTYPELRGGGTDTVFLVGGTDEALFFTINGEKIHAIHPNHPL